MKKYKNRRKDNKRKAVWIISSVVGVIFLIYFFLPSYLNLRKHIERNESLNMKLHELEKENEQLRAEIDKLKNDPLYIEKIARKELGMTRPGEIIYRIEEE